MRRLIGPVLCLSLLGGCQGAKAPSKSVDTAPKAIVALDAAVEVDALAADAAKDAAPDAMAARPATEPVELHLNWLPGQAWTVTVATTLREPEPASWTLTYRMETLDASGALAINRSAHALEKGASEKTGRVHKLAYVAMRESLLQHVGDLVLDAQGKIRTSSRLVEVDKALRLLLLSGGGTAERMHQTMEVWDRDITVGPPSLLRVITAALDGQTAAPAADPKTGVRLSRHVPCAAVAGCAEVSFERAGTRYVLTTDPLTLAPVRLEMIRPEMTQTLSFTAIAQAADGEPSMYVGAGRLLNAGTPWADERPRPFKLKFGLPKDAPTENQADVADTLKIRLAALRVNDAKVQGTERTWTVSGKATPTQLELVLRILPRRGQLRIGRATPAEQNQLSQTAYVSLPPDLMNSVEVIDGHLSANDLETLAAAHSKLDETVYFTGAERYEIAGEARWRTWFIATAGALSLGKPKSASIQEDPMGQTMVAIEFQPKDGEAFHAFTKAHVRDSAAIMLDRQVLMVPRIMEPVGGGRLQITIPRAVDGWLVAAALASNPIPSQLKLIYRK